MVKIRDHPYFHRFLREGVSKSDIDIPSKLQSENHSVYLQNDLVHEINSKYVVNERNVANGYKLNFKESSKDTDPHQILTTQYGLKDRLVKSWLLYVSRKQSTCKERGHKNILERDLLGFTDFQKKLLIENTLNYRDLCFIGYDMVRALEIREIACLHTLNHLLYARDNEMQNDETFRQARKRKRMNKIASAIDKKNFRNEAEVEIKDKGFSRPKVLLLFPTRVCCLKFMKLLFELLPNKAKISNKERFLTEFCNPKYGRVLSSDSFDELDFINGSHPLIKLDKKRYSSAIGRSKEYLNDFETNIPQVDLEQANEDDFRADFEAFKFGVRLREKKNLDLFTDFFKSDIIVSSPLDLKVSVGIKNFESFCPDFISDFRKTRDTTLLPEDVDEFGLHKLSKIQEEHSVDTNFDFLSSIELCIISECEKLLMQNYQHLIDIMNIVNLKPSKMRSDIDFPRIRPYFLEGRSQANCFLQILLFSAISHPLLKAFLKPKKNIAGTTIIKKSVRSAIIEDTSFRGVSLKLKRCDNILTFFKDKILPKIQRSASSIEGLLLVVSNYTNFLEIRNILSELSKSLNLEYDSRTLKEVKEDKKRMKQKKGFYIEREVVEQGLFGYLNEFSALTKITKLRSDFLKKKFRILMVSERFHYYYRYHLNGVKEVKFIGVPQFPYHFRDFSSMSLTKSLILIFTREDSFQLEAIAGSRARAFLSNKSSTFIVRMA